MNNTKMGRYEIVRELGKGGISVVYLAHDPLFNREVALKVLSRESTRNENFRELFESEIKILGRLEHPAIVPVYDVGVEENQFYFVMRYMGGGSLKERIAEKKFSLREAAILVERVCSALEEAHNKGIVHRDLKPANILLDTKGAPYISDFGIAKILSERGSDSQGIATKTKPLEIIVRKLRKVIYGSHTDSEMHLSLKVMQVSSERGNNVIVGTPAYMSPEQAQNKTIDQRSDIYSLGIILYEMLAGKLPFLAETPHALLYQHVHEPIPLIRENNPNLHPLTDMVISKALAKNYEDRFVTASEMASTLTAIADTAIFQDTANDATQIASNSITSPPRAVLVSKKPKPTIQVEKQKKSSELLSQPKAGSSWRNSTKFSRYEIQEEVGIGGMSTVYRAYDPMFEREVAIKVLKRELLEDPEIRERFERETKIVARLEHAAIVPVYDVGHDNGQLFYVMRYMSGGTLLDLMHIRPLVFEQIEKIIVRVAAALDYAHNRGIVHRDVKPSNILFDENDNAFIADFGIAKLSNAAIRITHSGIIGTPRYMSPEQARGEEADGRSDQYSLGVILFELLTEQTPFDAITPLAMAFKHATEPPPNILNIKPDLPVGMSTLLDKVLAKEANDRFVNVTEFSKALIRIFEGRDVYSSGYASRSLNLSGKGLREVPAQIFESMNLESLDLSNNQLKSLPDEIGRLKNLALLNISNNEITDLPSSVSQLTKLTGLVLSNNQFDKVPDVVVRLPNLISLDLRQNKIGVLPLELSELKKLSILELANNPLNKPPIEIARQGASAVKEYLRQLSLGQEQLLEAKLLILGEGGAGKTTLANKILNPNYMLRQNEPSTEGIDVLRWSFPFDGNKVFKVNIWDFGGQEIYHTTHQYFLTKRSLYALVADTRKEDTDFYYWLNIVELLSDNSPLLIIKNEKQDRHREISERQLRGQFDNIASILETNLADNRNLNEVISEIRHNITKLPHVGLQLPVTWVRVRQILEADDRNYINQNEFLNICWENGFEDTKDCLQLSEYLHDLGVVLHFQDDAVLKNTIILKPKWGTDATYKVLDNQAVIRNLGHFTKEQLVEIWSDASYDNMHDELLQLMMKFHLCYEIPDTKDMYIAPQLLTENQPHYDWNTDDNLILRYAFEFMPKGILTQFIVMMHHLIMKQKYVWKSGLIIERDNTRAEVVEYYGKREISVRISGIRKKELITIIIYQIDQILATYKQLKYNKLIPCNCPVCGSRQDGHFFPLVVLNKFRESGQDEIQCLNSGSMVKVVKLIDDVFPEKTKSQVADDQGEKSMTKYELNIGAGAKVDGPIVLGSRIDNSFIRESFNNIESANISSELKSVLQQLAQSVAEMNKALLDDDAKEAEKDFDMLVSEASQEKPRQRWYQVSINGLTKAAEKVGKIGLPVIELSGKVGSLLMALNK